MFLSSQLYSLQNLHLEKPGKSILGKSQMQILKTYVILIVEHVANRYLEIIGEINC